MYFGSGTTHTRKKTYLDKLLLLEETGYEKRQTSMIKTTVLQFMLEAPRKCTILCFLLANCYGIN